MGVNCCYHLAALSIRCSMSFTCAFFRYSSLCAFPFINHSCLLLWSVLPQCSSVAVEIQPNPDLLQSSQATSHSDQAVICSEPPCYSLGRRKCAPIRLQIGLDFLCLPLPFSMFLSPCSASAQQMYHQRADFSMKQPASRAKSRPWRCSELERSRG
jgi:hypothetical protein